MDPGAGGADHWQPDGSGWICIDPESPPYIKII
jgi:hypothetical protein